MAEFIDWIMEHLLTKGGALTTIATLVIGWIGREKVKTLALLAWGKVLQAIGKKIPGDTAIEKLALDQLNSVVQKIINDLLAGGIEPEKLATAKLVDLPVLVAESQRSQYVQTCTMRAQTKAASPKEAA